MTRALALVLGILLSGALGLAAGSCSADRMARAEARAAEAEQQLVELKVELAFERAMPAVVTRYVDRVQVVRERAQTIVREVPVHVTPTADARCPVPAGFVRLHDAAAANLPVPEGAGDPDAPAPGVALSTVAGTVAGNYATCHEIREQLIALQDAWLAAEEAARGQAR